MNRIEFLQDAIGEIDESLIMNAETVRQKKRRPFAFFVAAACLTVMLLAIPLGILIANRNETPNVPIITTVTPPTTTIPPQTTTRPSVLDIPGAAIFENDGSFQTSPGRGTSATVFYSFNDAQKRAWAKRVKEENDVVVGYIKDYTSVLVPDGKAYYRITTMEIAVLEDFSGVESETVKAVYANRYEWDLWYYIPVTKYTVGDGMKEGTDEIVPDMGFRLDMFQQAQEVTYSYNEGWNHAGFILLKDAKDQSLTIEEETYALSDYADYVLEACLYYDKDFDRIDLHELNHSLTVRSGLMREVFRNMITFDRGPDQPFFNFENSYKAFDGNIAIKLELWKAVGRIYYNSIFYDTLFIDPQPLEAIKINPEYTWVITIDGVKYEITRFDLQNYSSRTEIYLDLGSDFSWNLFDYDENRHYTFENVRLDIYDSEGNLLCYSPLTNNYRCPGGYTHTKPN